MELPTTLETKERAPEFRRRNLAMKGQFQNVLGNLMDAAKIQVDATAPSENLTTRPEETKKPTDEEVPETERPEEEDLADTEAAIAYQQTELADVEQPELAIAVVSGETESNPEATSEVLNIPEQTDAPAEVLTRAIESDETLTDGLPDMAERSSGELTKVLEVDSELSPETDQPLVHDTEVDQVQLSDKSGTEQIEASLSAQSELEKAPAKTDRTSEQAQIASAKPAETKAAVEQSNTLKPATNTEADSATIKLQEVDKMAVEPVPQEIAEAVTSKPELLERFAGETDSPEHTVVKGTESALPIPENQLSTANPTSISQMVPVTAMAISAAPIPANQAPQLTVQGTQAVARAQNAEQAVPIKEVAAAEKSRVDVKRSNTASKPESARNLGSRQIEIIRQVAKNIALRGATKNTEIKLALSPPNLGTVKLTISINEGVMSGSIVTESQSIRHMLQQQIPELREALAQDGIQLGDLDVSTEQNQQQTNTQQRSKQPMTSPQRPQMAGAETRTETKPEAATVNDGRVQGYM